MSYADLAMAFEAMNPTEKALFIDARLAWATNMMLIGELQKRMYHTDE